MFRFLFISLLYESISIVLIFELLSYPFRAFLNAK